MQLNEKQADQIRATLKTLQVICFALIGGVVVTATIFGGIADWNNLTTDLSLLALIGTGLAAVLVAQSVVLPGIIATASAKSMDTVPPADRVEKLAMIFQNKTIIRFAMLEGAAFLNAILFMVDKNLIPLGVVIFIVAVMLTTIPRENSVFSWIEERIGD